MARLVVAPAFLIACLIVLKWLMVMLGALLLLGALRAWLDPSVPVQPLALLLPAVGVALAALGCGWLARRVEALVR